MSEFIVAQKNKTYQWRHLPLVVFAQLIFHISKSNFCVPILNHVLGPCLATLENKWVDISLTSGC